MIKKIIFQLSRHEFLFLCIFISGKNTCFVRHVSILCLPVVLPRFILLFLLSLNLLDNNIRRFRECLILKFLWQNFLQLVHSCNFLRYESLGGGAALGISLDNNFTVLEIHACRMSKEVRKRCITFSYSHASLVSRLISRAIIVLCCLNSF